jgi:DNA-binding NarL/FixJ family response regulator
MIKVLITDDEVILRDSLKIMVEQDEEIQVIGTAGDGREAFEFCRVNQPEVILMDIRMPNCDGVTGTRIIKEMFPEIKVIILTTFNDDENVTKALKYGASGYILKNIGSTELIEVIKSTYKGLPILDQAVLNTVINNFDVNATVNSMQKYNLSDKQVEVIQLIVEGKCNKEIASHLFLSEGRVKNIITEILGKCEVEDRLRLAVFAVKNKLC